MPALASTVDISATILDRAGLAPYNGIQGLSLLSAIDSPGDYRDALLIEHNEAVADFGFQRPPRVRSLVTPRWRYTIYAGENWGELYNVENDPGETRNLWDEPEHASTRSRLAEALNEALTFQMDESPLATRVA